MSSILEQPPRRTAPQARTDTGIERAASLIPAEATPIVVDGHLHGYTLQGKTFELNPPFRIIEERTS